MKLGGEQVAAALGGDVLARGAAGPPRRATIDSGLTGPGDLFLGLKGERRDGGEFAPAALAAGAWGAVLSRAALERLGPLSTHPPDAGAGGHGGPAGEDAAWILAVTDPLAALQGLARAERRARDVPVLGVTGSVGKTSVKDIARALLPGRVHANRQNLNTEIGLPLTVLEAPEEVDLMVLEMAMRGPGQIAELAAIAEPGVVVITNVGPVHVELLGSIEAIAAAKAEALASLPADGVAVVPAQAGALEPHLESAPRLLRFGPGGEVEAVSRAVADGSTRARVRTPAGEVEFEFPFAESYNLTNALAAIAAGVALGADVGEMASRAGRIGFSRFRGERLDLGEGIVLVNDCYNANPVSMRAALDHLGTLQAPRLVAVLGEMAELGPGAPTHHREIGEHARTAGIDLLIGVGAAARRYAPDELVGDPGEAAELLAARLEPGDAVLVKGSRSAGLERVAEALAEARGAPGGEGARGRSSASEAPPPTGNGAA